MNLTGEEIAIRKFIGLQVTKARVMNFLSKRFVANKCEITERVMRQIEYGSGENYSSVSLYRVVAYLGIKNLDTNPTAKKLAEINPRNWHPNFKS